MIDTDIETQTPYATHEVANPITFAFALARLQQATIDCAYIFFDQSEPFINGQRRKKYKSRMQIVQEQRENMLAWLNSDDFHATCELVGQNSDIMCRALKRIMNMQDNATKVVSEYSLRIAKKVLIFGIVFGLCLPVYCQPFKLLPGLRSFDSTVPEIVSLEKITQNPIPFKVNGQSKVSYFTVYTYKMKNGKKIDMPILIKGIKNHLRK
jgi:hypothetical protein